MFFEKLSRFVTKFNWVIIVLWLLIAGVLLWKAPVLSEVAKTDQASFVPDNSEVVKAAKLIKSLYPEKGSGSSLALVYQRKGGLTGQDRDYEKKLEDYLNSHKSYYNVKDFISPFRDKEFEASMISKKGDTAFVAVRLNVPGYFEKTNEIIRTLRDEIQGGREVHRDFPAVPRGLKIYVTGDAAFAQEELDNVQKSMAMTGIITVALVSLVLLLIYRSPIAVTIPLLTIGISFLVSRGLVAILAKSGLGVSSFTETFLIAVLFGAGTDYCLLLVSRFREEIVSGRAAREALRAAMPNTSMAIVSSGGTVIIGFLAMVFAKFGLYSTTGPSIAIGVAITIAAVLTLTPAVISILGEMIFWPAHPSRNIEKERKGSPFWNRLSAAVTTKPARFIVVCLVIFTPFIITTMGINRSFDQLKELPANSDAVKGFETIKDNFNQGEVLPVSVTLKADKDLWSNESLQIIDDIAKNISKVDGVAKVRTATRPLGEQITETTLPKQIELLSNGLGQVKDGFDPVIEGIDKLHGGVKKVSEGLSGGSSALGKLADGTKKVSGSISQVGSGLGSMSSGQQAAIDGLSQVGGGMALISSEINKSKGQVETLSTALQGVQKTLEAVLAEQPGMAKDKNFQTAYGMIKMIAGSVPGFSTGLDSLDSGIKNAKTGIDKTSKGLKDIKGGLDKSKEALQKILAGMDDIKRGQDKAGEGIAAASSSLEEIAAGFQPARDGLEKMKSGLNEARSATGDYSSKRNSLNGVFYLPDGALEEFPDLRRAMENYISKDGKGITFDVVLSLQPYSPEAMDSINKIRDAVGFTIKDSALDKSEFHVSGPTAVMSELRQMTFEDFLKVIFFVLLGIFIVLAFLLRSITAPVYLILTILFSFATTMGISYLVFQVGLGEDGLSWSVPFFSFCILVALGVDYNIFLMARVKEEYKPGDVTGGTARALASTGKIITSCGLIMAGTFGALMASPVNQLVQIGFSTVIGLLIDTFIIRCLMVPAIAVKVGELNWWPGKKVRVVSCQENSPGV